MNQFTIFAHGKDFEPNSYLKQKAIDFDRVWHRDDAWDCPEFIEDKRPTGGVEKILGDGLTLTIREQDRIATEFLEKHEKKLAELAKYPGVDHFILKLQYRMDLDPSVRGFYLSFSARLMYFALRVGVEPIICVDLAPSDDWDEF